MRPFAFAAAALFLAGGCGFWPNDLDIFLLAVVCGYGSGNIETTLETLDAEGNPRASFAEGEEITFVITVRNKGLFPYRATGWTCAGTSFHLTVADQDNVVYEYPSPLIGAPCWQIEVYIEPGGEKTETIVWDQSETWGSPVGPGNYVAECSYLNKQNTASRDFAIE